MSSTSRPKLTNPLRPVARYRKGKAPIQGLVPSDDDDSDEDDTGAKGEEDEGDVPIGGESDDEQQQEEEEAEKLVALRGEGKGKGKGAAGAEIKVELKRVQVTETGAVKIGGKEEVGRTARELEEQEGSSEEEGESAGCSPREQGRRELTLACLSA